jgi:cysteine desulfurase
MVGGTSYDRLKTFSLKYKEIMQLFLDANAHLPLHPKALEAYIQFNNSLGGHGHAMSISKPGRCAAAALEDARSKIAKLIGAESPNQIIFTSSCTQACEWGLELLKAQNFKTVYSSTIEHRAVDIKSRQLFGNNDLFTNKHGIVSCTFIPPNNSAFVCMHVQNEIGTVQDIENINVPFFCDMSQSLGKIPINVSKTPNLMIGVFGAHKFGGPINIGFMYLRDTKWWKEFGTGSRYYFDRTGTPDVGMIVATSVALEEAINTLQFRYQNALRFRSIIESAAKSIGINIIGDGSNRIPHATFLNIGKRMGPHIMAQLEEEGIFVGLGSACGSLHSNTSPIMSALGYGGSSQDNIRISQWGYYGEKEAQVVARAIIKYCPKTTV